MTRMITDAQMAAYWARRVQHLRSLRPISATEALAEAASLDRRAARLRQAVADAERAPRESGRVADGDTVAARHARNAAALGAARRAVWGYITLAQQAELRAAALRRVAAQPEGAALAESLAVARRRSEHYGALAAVAG